MVFKYSCAEAANVGAASARTLLGWLRSVCSRSYTALFCFSSRRMPGSVGSVSLGSSRGGGLRRGARAAAFMSSADMRRSSAIACSLSSAAVCTRSASAASPASGGPLRNDGSTLGGGTRLGTTLDTSPALLWLLLRPHTHTRPPVNATPNDTHTHTYIHTHTHAHGTGDRTAL